jgi:hypothetical protein
MNTQRTTCLAAMRSTLALLAFCSVADATGPEASPLKDDYKALQSPQGFWTKSTGKGKTELHFKGKQFPKLEVTITELVPGGKGLVPKESFKVGAVVQEKDGKRVLVIEGTAIAYGFRQGRDFLVLKGEFEHKKKRINLTGNWGSTLFK